MSMPPSFVLMLCEVLALSLSTAPIESHWGGPLVAFEQVQLRHVNRDGWWAKVEKKMDDKLVLFGARLLSRRAGNWKRVFEPSPGTGLERGKV